MEEDYNGCNSLQCKRAFKVSSRGCALNSRVVNLTPFNLISKLYPSNHTIYVTSHANLIGDIISNAGVVVCTDL